MPKHHYVPQFYLKNFCIPGNETVFVYPRKRKIFPAHPNKIAAKNDFYTYIDSHGKANSDMEIFYSKLESEVAPIILRLINGSDFQLSLMERFHMTYFMTTLLTRNELFRESTIELMKKAEVVYADAQFDRLAKEAQDENSFREYSRKNGLTYKSESDYQNMRDDLINKRYTATLENKDIYAAGLATDIALNLAESVWTRRWHLITAIGSRDFITSDNPVTRMRPGDVSTERRLTLADMYYAIPISPRKLIIIDPVDGNTFMEKWDSSDVKRIVEMQIKGADRFIYASFESKDIKKAFDNTIEGYNRRVKIDIQYPYKGH